MPDPIATLASIPFGVLIGDPLVAAIQAEAQAAASTLTFVNSLGSSTMTFTYDKIVQGTSGLPEEQQVTITVPTLALVRPPVLRVESVDIEFLAKINTMEYSEKSTQFDIGGSLEFRQRWFGGGVALRVSAAYQSKTRDGNTRTDDYSISVKVHAGQADMPAGMAKVFGLIESALHETPA